MIQRKITEITTEYDEKGTVLRKIETVTEETDDSVTRSTYTTMPYDETRAKKPHSKYSRKTTDYKPAHERV